MCSLLALAMLESVSTVCQNWALIVVLSILLNVVNQGGPVIVLANPALRVYQLGPGVSESLQIDHSPASVRPFDLVQLTEYTPSGGQIVSVPLDHVSFTFFVWP